MLKSIKLSLFFLFIFQSVCSQSNWTVEEMAPMPEPVTNNAVCEAFTYGQIGFQDFISEKFVFSFGGIERMQGPLSSRQRSLICASTLPCSTINN